MVNKLQSETPGTRELNNLRIRGRIIKRVYDNPGCNITSIIKGKGIPKNSKSLGKRIAELQKTDYFQTLIPWNEKCFYIYLKNDPDFLSFKTFCRIKNNLAILCDSDDFIKNSNVYKEFIGALGVKSLHKTAKHHFRTKPIEYNYKLKRDTDIQEQVLRQLFSTYHRKILLYLRVEDYNKKDPKPCIQLDITRRIEDITEFILKYAEDSTRKIDTLEFEEYVTNYLLPNLKMEHKATKMVLNFAMEDLVAKNKPKRKILRLNDRINAWDKVLATHFDPRNPKYIPSKLTNILKPIMSKDGKPDFLLIDRIVALEQGQNGLIAGNYVIDDFLHNWMNLNPIEIDLCEINKETLA